MKRILFNIPVLLILILSSCKDDPFISVAKPGQMCFTITTQGEAVIDTRAADYDNSINDVYVLFFEGTGDDSKLQTLVPATSTNSGVYYASVDNGDYKYFYVAANIASTINGYKEQWQENHPTLGEVKNALKMTLSTSAGTIIDDPKFAPMISGSTLYQGLEYTGYHATLVRATAKVTVRNASKNSRYKLYGANLGNAPVEGYLFGDQQPSTKLANYAGRKSDGSYSLESMMRSAIIPDSTEVEPLYLFETPKGNETFVIIQGEYDGVVGYHRLNIWNKDDAYKYYDIQRNYHYILTINKIYTTGYATPQEAIASGGANRDMDVSIEVIDPTSRDIVSNGEYYLGVSNSELWLFNSNDLADLTATTVVTSAGSSVKRSCTVKVTEGTGTIGCNDPFTAADHLLKINIPQTVISAEVTLRVGDLARKIKIQRKVENTSVGGTILLDESCAYGKIESGNGSWIKLSDKDNPVVGDGEDEYINQAAAKKNLWLVLENNLKLDEASPNVERNAELVLFRANDEGHIKLLLNQPVFDIFDKDENTPGNIVNPFVGAFWRYNQTGERVIKMEVNGLDSEITWDALTAVGSDWMGLEKGGSSDAKIYSNYPDLDDNSTFKTTYKVKNPKNYISGDMADVIFRIGLKSEIGENEHRYGLVIVNIYLSGKLQNTYRIFTRQGDAPDYIFRNGDRGYEWNGSRSKAVKFSPYNLTDPKLGVGSKGDYLGHNAMPLDYYQGTTTTDYTEFTKFPSQAGYFFIWNVAPKDQISNTAIRDLYPSLKNTEMMRAVHPINNSGLTIPLAYFDAKMYDANFLDMPIVFDPKGDPCPYGYRSPSVGKVNLGGATSTSIANSELIQSLLFDPNAPAKGSSATVMAKYTLWGYYADGFFDRLPIRSIASSGSGSSVIVAPNTLVSPGTGGAVMYGSDLTKASGNDIGYIGMIIFNPYNLGSIFFPATGYLTPFSLVEPGTSVHIWSTERDVTDVSRNGNYPMDFNGTRIRFSIFSSQGTGGFPRAVRCVRDETKK